MATYYTKQYDTRKNKSLDERENYGSFSSANQQARDDALKDYMDYGTYNSRYTNKYLKNYNDIAKTKYNSKWEPYLNEAVSNVRGIKPYVSQYTNQISNTLKNLENQGPYKSEFANDISGTRNQIANYGNYESRYQDQIDKYMDALSKDYDPSQDSMYDYYRQAYMRGGQQAMQNATAAAAANSGGFGNSYAASQGQQQYNQYMSALADRIPELSKAAMDMYGMRLDALNSRDAIEYGRWNDRLSNLYNELGMWTDADETAYNRFKDDRDNYYNMIGLYSNLDDSDYGRYKDWNDTLFDQANLARTLERDTRSDYEYDLDNKYRLGEYLLAGDANERANYTTNADYLKGRYDTASDAMGMDYDIWHNGLTDIDNYIGLLDNLENSGYNIYSDNERLNETIRQNDIAQANWEAEQAYQAARDAEKDRQWQAEYDAGQAQQAAENELAWARYNADREDAANDYALRQAAAAATANASGGYAANSSGNQQTSDRAYYDDLIARINRSVNDGATYQNTSKIITDADIDYATKQELYQMAQQATIDRDDKREAIRKDASDTQHGGSSRGYTR